jgi:cyclic-di-GMP-binding protein
MPSFDVVSELHMQEVRNAVDQASRELANRYDFKGTDSSVVLGEGSIRMESSTEDRLKAVQAVLEEKLVRRQVSLKAVTFGKVEDAAGGRARQTATLVAGISSDKARELNKLIKGLGIKGVQSQTQGDQLRVISKQRDSLQEVIAALKAAELDIALQYTNFRD